MKTKIHESWKKTRGGYRENAGRKSTWRHQETCTIRIPKNLSKKLLELAHFLDSVENIDNVTFSTSTKFDLVTESKPGEIQMTSTKRFDSEQGQIENDTESKIINYTVIPPGDTSWFNPGNNQQLFTQIEKDTKSITTSLDKVTNSINSDLSGAINQAKKILKFKKSARYSLARLLSKLYSASVSIEDLK